MMAELSELLRAAAADIEHYEVENNDLSRRLTVAEGAKREELRLVYRRGYFAGHSAGTRGQMRETAPERRIRGDALREKMDL